MSLFHDGVIWVKLLRAVQIVMVLGGIILVHEFGHFIVARLSKMHVDEFAIGMGPTLWSVRRGEGGTLYRVCPFLFMGYVRIRGLEGETDADRLPDSFYTRPVPHRLAVLAAGAVMNVIFALLVFCALFGWYGVPEPPDTSVAQVVAGSAASQAGIEAGWRIAAVDGAPTARPIDVRKRVDSSGGRPLRLTLANDGQTRDLTVQPRQERAGGAWRIGVVFRDEGGYTTTIGKVDPGKPAWKAGLRSGDRIVRLNDKPVRFPTEVLQALTTVPKADELKQPNQVALAPIAVTAVRQGVEQTFAVQPEPKRDQRLKDQPQTAASTKPAEQTVEQYLIGDVGLVLARRFTRLSLAASIGEGGRRSWEVLSNVFEQLGTLLRGEHLDQVGGPVQIVKFLSEAAFLGVYELLNWAGILSIMIGVFNLLPLPALDGGRIVFVLLEPVSRRVLALAGSRDPRELNRRIETFIHAAGLMLLLGLMLLVSVRDLRRW